MTTACTSGVDERRVFNILIMLQLILFVVGFILIFYFSDVIIDNIKDLVKLRNISPFLLGALLLGIDLEEIIASLTASTLHYPTVALGNVIGNTIISLSLPFAIPALVRTFKVKKPPKQFTVGLAALVSLHVINLLLGGVFSFVFLITAFISISIYTIITALNVNSVRNLLSRQNDGNSIDKLEYYLDDDDDEGDGDENGHDGEGDGRPRKHERDEIGRTNVTNGISIDNQPKRGKIGRKIGKLISAAAIISIGAYFLSIGLEGIIVGLGISQDVMGYVIVALGTNVEEFLMISKSVKKKVPGVGTGGIIMKCIWNLAVTFGISMFIFHDVPVDLSLMVNSGILVITTAVTLLSLRGEKIGKKIGFVYLAIFVLFITINLANIPL
ncbi:MAG: sodium:calcium antiporter [Promethearchaeota archaeon]